MTTATEAAIVAPARPCPNCGKHVPEGGRGMGKDFCDKDCREKFNYRNKARGAVIMPFIQAQMMTRHAKPGTREAEVCTFARGELTEIAGIFNDEDREAGRPPAWMHVAKLMDQKSRYVDRMRR